MTVLITGGFGYIGGRLARRFASGGVNIRLGTRRPLPTPAGLGEARVVQTPWDSTSGLEAICAGVDVVVHLAGANAADCAADPVAALTANGLATARLTHAATRSGVSRFIYLSTAHVYGSTLSGVISESDVLTGLHPYATSHRAGEDVVRAAHARREIDGVVIRLSNAFGAPATAEVDCWRLLCNDLSRQAVTTGRMALETAGLQRRDFITMTDTCRAIEHLMSLPSERLGDGVFNVGGSWSPTVLEFAGILRSVAARILRSDLDLSIPGGPIVASHPLTFGIDKLLATGFALTRDHVSEMTELLRFCADAFGGSPASARLDA